MGPFLNLKSGNVDAHVVVRENCSLATAKDLLDDDVGHMGSIHGNAIIFSYGLSDIHGEGYNWDKIKQMQDALLAEIEMSVQVAVGVLALPPQMNQGVNRKVDKYNQHLKEWCTVYKCWYIDPCFDIRETTKGSTQRKLSRIAKAIQNRFA